MKFVCNGLKLLWIVIMSVMLATGMVSLLPSNGIRYGVLTNHISLLPWLFWILAIVCAFIIFEIAIRDLHLSKMFD